MFKAIAQLFIGLTVLFKAVGRFFHAFDAIAETAEDSANAFRDERKLEIRSKRIELEKRLEDAPKPKANSKDFQF